MSDSVITKPPREFVIPEGRLAESMPDLKSLLASHSYSAYLSDPPYAVGTDGKFQKPPVKPHPIASLRAVKGEDATPVQVVAVEGDDDFDEAVRKAQRQMEVQAVDRVGGRATRVLYDSSTNRVLKPSERDKRLACDAWFTACLVNYSYLIKDIPKGDIFAIWAILLEEGRMRPHEVATRTSALGMWCVLPGESHRDFWKRIDTEVATLESMGVEVDQAAIDSLKVIGLKYHIRYEDEYDVRKRSKQQSHYYETILSVDRIEKRLESLPKPDLYVDRLDDQVESEGLKKATAKSSNKKAPRTALGLLGQTDDSKKNSNKICFSFRDRGVCNRRDCRFSHGSKNTHEGRNEELFDKCKQQKVCFFFNTETGCVREGCKFTHKKIEGDTPKTDPPPRSKPDEANPIKCKKCKKVHKGSCKAQANQAVEESDDEEITSEGDEVEEVSSGLTFEIGGLGLGFTKADMTALREDLA